MKVNTFTVGELQEQAFFTADAFLDKKFLLLPPGVAVSEDLKNALLDWEFRSIYSEGEITEQFNESDYPETAPESDAALEEVVEASSDTGSNTEDDSLAVIEKAYYDFQTFIEAVYTRYATKKDLNLQTISDRVKELCEFIRENKRYVLRIQPSQESRERNYLVVHSMRSTVFAIVIGLQLKFPIHKLIELGVSCILHEIGMIRLPPQLYMGNRPLAPAEKNAILTHPVLSYNILREFSFPLNICLGVLEHHERENGAGYPRKLTKEKISIYAKIIAVACSYEAVTAPRPYKEAQDAYSGIIEIMKNVGKQYDETIIRALLFSLSLYPIGLYVLLSNNKIGQVVDVNPENPKFPIVQLYGETAVDGKPRLIETGEYAIKIVRPLSKEEGATLLKTT